MESKLCKCGATALHDNIICASCWTRLTSVIVHDGCGGAIYISSKQWDEYESYKQLKKKWSWLD